MFSQGYSGVVGVMKMGNIVPRAGIKLTSLAFRASVLPLNHYAHAHLPMQLFTSVQTTTVA